MIRPEIERVFTENLSRVYSLIEEDNLDAIVLTSTSNITYVTGIRQPSGVVVLSKDCGSSIAVPLLDYVRITRSAPRDFDIYVISRSGEESIHADVPRSRLIRGSSIDFILYLYEKCGFKKIGIDLSNSNYVLYKKLIQINKIFNINDITQKVNKIRSIKNELEIKLILKAIDIAQKAFTDIYNSIEQGIREIELAGKLFYKLTLYGAWYEAFPSIVAFYSNTALPHHTPGPETFTHPGPILVDWGAIVDGYRSDMTRTWWQGGDVPAKFSSILEAVRQAQDEAIDIISPGVEAWEVDNAARRVLSRNGYDKYFIHGLGHGVGVDIHEEPYLRPGSKTVLEPGMIITIEPGVYIPELYGVRIEDMVLVTRRGARVLTRTARVLP